MIQTCICLSLIPSRTEIIAQLLWLLYLFERSDPSGHHIVKAYVSNIGFLGWKLPLRSNVAMLLSCLSMVRNGVVPRSMVTDHYIEKHIRIMERVDIFFYGLFSRSFHPSTSVSAITSQRQYVLPLFSFFYVFPFPIRATYTPLCEGIFICRLCHLFSIINVIITKLIIKWAPLGVAFTCSSNTAELKMLTHLRWVTILDFNYSPK